MSHNKKICNKIQAETDVNEEKHYALTCSLFKRKIFAMSIGQLVNKMILQDHEYMRLHAL